MNACCADPAKRTEPEQLAENLSVTYCTQCGRRHFEAVAQPIRVGVTGAKL